jgi:hypothetical protein
MRVTVWNEFRHERANPAVAVIYPAGIHATIAQALRAAGVEDVRTATLDEPAQGLPPEILARTDVLVWWGHQHHDEVGDDLARAICDRVHGGMGLVVLHSGHFSKPFRRLMGTPCTVRWRADGELERIWVVAPSTGGGRCSPGFGWREKGCIASRSGSRARRACLHQLVQGRRGVPGGWPIAAVMAASSTSGHETFRPITMPRCSG